MFRLNEMHFGIDGLESESELLTHEDAEACYRKLEEIGRTDPTLLGRVIEIDSEGNPVYTEGTSEKPYPHVVEAPIPSWFH